MLADIPFLIKFIERLGSDNYVIEQVDIVARHEMEEMERALRDE